jgi:hypothetical protein
MQMDYVADPFGSEILHYFRQIQRRRLGRAGAGATSSEEDQRRSRNRRQPSPGTGIASDKIKLH